MKKIPYGKQYIDESDIQSIVSVFDTDFLTTGPSVAKFEEKLCEVSGAKYAVACSNGTAALHLACLALGIKKGDLALTTPLTFLASANCVEYCGGNVDFIDIDSDTLCISVEKIKEYCDKIAVPKVVIPVDFAGVPADLVSIHKLSKKYGFKIIEDAAHSIGSTYNADSNKIASGSCIHSDLAIFSFHPVKTVTTAEGGAVMTNDKELFEKLCLFRNHGMRKTMLDREDGPWYYEMHELGFNFRITDIQCALGLSQLSKLKSFKSRRAEIFNKYSDNLKDISGLILPPWPDTTDPCYHLYVLQFEGGDTERLRVYCDLQAKNIFTQVHYYPVHLQPFYKTKYGYTEGKCPNAEKYYLQCLSLPLYPQMTDNDVEYVIESLKETLSLRGDKC